MIFAFSFCVVGCGPELDGAHALGSLSEQPEAPEDLPDSFDESASEEPAMVSSCDAVAGDCPSPVILRSGDVFTVFFDYLVDGEEAKEFSATGTSPQVALSPVMVGAEGAGNRASIEVTAHAVGDGTVDIVIWYGENKAIERNYNLLVSIIES